MQRITGAVLALAVLTGGLAACTPHAARPGPAPGPHWRRITLPASPGGRSAIRGVASCGGVVYVAGTTLAPDGSTRPAMWEPSGGGYTAMAVRPVTVYGPDDALLDVACRPGTIVAVGARSGGAHGNLRTSTWHSSAGGPLTEVSAAFELFGGPAAIGVGPVAGGPAGFLITGARLGTTGPTGAVWYSPDGTAFTLIDDDPALRSDGRGITEVHDAAAGPDGFVAVGAVTPPGARLAARDPLVWTSPDGRHWTRTAPATTPADDPLLRVSVLADGTIVALGTSGSAFTVWHRDPSTKQWHDDGTFGKIDGSSIPGPVSLASIGRTVYAVVSDGDEYQLWRGTPGSAWTRVALPLRVASAPVPTGPRVVAVAVADGRPVLVTDDGTTSAVWTQ